MLYSYNKNMSSIESPPNRACSWTSVKLFLENDCKHAMLPEWLNLSATLNHVCLGRVTWYASNKSTQHQKTWSCLRRAASFNHMLMSTVNCVKWYAKLIGNTTQKLRKFKDFAQNLQTAPNLYLRASTSTRVTYAVGFNKSQCDSFFENLAKLWHLQFPSYA